MRKFKGGNVFVTQLYFNKEIQRFGMIVNKRTIHQSERTNGVEVNNYR